MADSSYDIENKPDGHENPDSNPEIWLDNVKVRVIDGIHSSTSIGQFDKHWDGNLTTEIPGSKAEIADEFLSPLIDYAKKQASCSILDAGCGDGVHMMVLDNIEGVTWGYRTAVDISLSATKAARQRADAYWQLVHADIGELPFKDESFDILFSYGVVAYTNNPQGTIQELTRVLKSGGKMGIWIYPRPKGLKALLLNTTRRLSTILGNWGTSRMADLIVPFLGILPVASGVNLSNATWKQCREVVMVNIAPQQLYFPEPEEVEQWLVESGLEIERRNPKRPITLYATKRG